MIQKRSTALERSVKIFYGGGGGGFNRFNGEKHFQVEGQKYRTTGYPILSIVHFPSFECNS